MQPTSLREALRTKLTKKEHEALKTAFDQVGSIAIIEIPDELIKKEKLIADTLLEMHNNIKTVVKKKGHHKGRFRIQQYKILEKKKKKETIFKENGVRILLHIEKTYFSVRLSTERLRIAKQIKKGEEILVMFSGVCPYPIVFSKNTEAKSITGVELNPQAHEYALANIVLNKCKNIEVYNGDVRIVVPKLKKKFDRILMPLPKNAEDFLDTALKASKKGTIIHFYDFLHQDHFPLAEQKVAEACKEAKKKFKVLNFTKCGQQSPRTFRICLDFKVL